MISVSKNLEPMTGFEPVTSSLPRKCSTPELHWQYFFSSERSTSTPVGRFDPENRRLFHRTVFASFLWAKMDSNHRRRKPADLQSAPFGHSGICPFQSFRFSSRAAALSSHSALRSGQFCTRSSQLISVRNGCKFRHNF